jgi:hypothetical protein
VIWDVTDDEDDLPLPDRSEPYTSVVHPTPAEVSAPSQPSSSSGNGTPK